MSPEYHYTVAEEQELDKLLSGTPIEGSTLWNNWSKPSRPKAGTRGLVWAADDRAEGLARPLVLISHEDDIRRKARGERRGAGPPVDHRRHPELEPQ